VIKRVICASVVLVVISTVAGPARAGTTRLPAAAGRAARDAGARIEAAELTGASAVKLDGEFSETAWELATPIEAFVQRDPQEGAAPSQRTEVRVLYDKACLYIAVRAFDAEPHKIVGIKTRRDGNSPSDFLGVFVDSYHDRRTGYLFGVNAAGVKKDSYFFNDSNQDDSWDAVWDVEVTKDAEGWKAEFRIPFSQLRFEPGKRDTFGFAVWREIPRVNEIATWPMLAKSRSGFVSQFGELGGLKLTGSAKRLELTPYVVGQAQTMPAGDGNPFVKSPDGSGSFGADVKYAMTPGLTLTGTANPDFGQVEADPAVVNLTSFETFYQERRPFFVEGSGNLRFDLDCSDGACTGLFYSRRIGRQPRGYPDVPDGGYASVPRQTTILGAAKVTGRAGAFSVGGLTALTAEERADVAFGLQQTASTVEPLTNYTLAQAKREFSNQSSLGFMFTNTARRLNDDVSFLPASATTGGVNWDWRLKDKQYSMTGYWAGSSVRGSAEAIDALQTSAVHNYQRPDAGHVDYDPARTSMNGHAGMLGFQKIGGKKVRFSLVGNYKSPGFDINDVGYVRRADTIQQSGWVQFRWDTPTRAFRTFRLNLNQWAGWNFDGDRRSAGANVNAHIVLKSNWSAGAGANFIDAVVDDRSTRGGPSFLSARGGNVWYYLNTDQRKAVNGGWMGYYYRNEQGSVEYGFDPEVTWRPTSFLSLSGGVRYSKSDNDTQWVQNIDDAPSTRYVFGRIRQTTVALTTRVNYTITPNLTVQIYAQPFVSAGEYNGFKELVRPHAQPYSSQFTPYAYGGNPDFNYQSLRMTNVLRWEYKPGSALYVVWQQGRETVHEQRRFDFNRDFGDVFGIPASNVFLVKFSYWLNF
jgi:hypothetical protein